MNEPKNRPPQLPRSLFGRARTWATETLPADAAMLAALLAALIHDRRVPWSSRVLAALALAYLASPIDLIPDVIPVLGQLDDAVVTPGLLTLALRRIPPDVVAEARQTARSWQTHWRLIGIALVALVWLLILALIWQIIAAVLTTIR